MKLAGKTAVISTVTKIPTVSQTEERIITRARAHRRTWMEPMPKVTKSPARNE
jgi:hypothetical protein